MDTVHRLPVHHLVDNLCHKLNTKLLFVLPIEDRSFAKCLNALKALQEKISNSGIEEHEEVISYDNAERVLQSFESE